MITYVRGRVVETGPDRAVVDVGGIGLTLLGPPGAFLELPLGQEASIPTSLVVREDSWTLYGFASAGQRADFEACQQVPGVGPKVAMAIVGALTPTQLRRAIERSDLATLTKVPGIGQKGAARLVVELTGRLLPQVDVGSEGTASGSGAQPDVDASTAGWRHSVLSALQSLGWTAREAETAVDAIADQVEPSADVAVALRAALSALRGPA